MAATRLAPVQVVFLSLVLVSALYVCKVSCVIQYTRWELLNLKLNTHGVLGPSLPKEITFVSPGLPTFWPQTGKRSRPQTGKRSRRSSILSRFKKRPHRPLLPALLLSNVRSLRYKMDELQLLIQTNMNYSNCSAICLTESWLDQSMPDQAVTLPGYTLHRADRSAELSSQKVAEYALW